MATLAHSVTKGIAVEWDGMYGSAVLSGIVGDAAHQKKGGYHISIQDQSSTNFSVTRPDDKAPPGTWPRNLAAAIDMSMNPSDMALCTGRLWNVWYNRANDPRAQYINAFNGWFNDGGPAKRYDFVSGKISETTSDHKWHVHLEIRRRWVTAMVAAHAILSILRGETIEQYLNSLKEAVMFANHGDNNGYVMAMQGEVNDVLRDMGFSGADLLKEDGEYGDKTAAGLLRAEIGNTDNGGKMYWAGEYRKLTKKLRDISAREAVAAHLAAAQHGAVQLPESIQLTIPSATVTAQLRPAS